MPGLAASEYQRVPLRVAFALAVLMAGVVLARPMPAAAQDALQTLICEDSPLRFRWFGTWDLGTNQPPQTALGRVELEFPSDCDEWVLVLGRGNFRSEVGVSVFDEFIFASHHIEPPPAPEHGEGINRNVIVFHVDGGVLQHLPTPGRDFVPVPMLAQMPFDPGMRPGSGRLAQAPNATVEHPGKGHQDIGVLKYRTFATRIQFRFTGRHTTSTVPEPVSIVSLGTGLAGVALALALRRRRGGASGPAGG